MTYELAKQLKDAEFNQVSFLLVLEANNKDYCPSSGFHLVLDEPELVEGIGIENCKKRRAYCYSLVYLDSDEGKNNTVYIPTLEELIEACGVNFTALYYIQHRDEWSATTGEELDFEFTREGRDRFTGKTPSEAVARLWLALKK